jgi:hypothetical protein
MLALQDINFVRLFAFKKDINASIISSNDAFIGIVVRRWISLAKEIETPIFESHTALLIVVKTPMFLRTNFFERCSEFSFEVFKFHVRNPMPDGARHLFEVGGQPYRHFRFLQSSSASRLIKGASGFFVLTQSHDG